MTVVALHAFPLDERMWDPQRSALVGHELVTPRLYGRGRTMDAWVRSILAEVQGAGHLLNLERPEEFNGILAEFLDRG